MEEKNTVESGNEEQQYSSVDDLFVDNPEGTEMDNAETGEGTGAANEENQQLEGSAQAGEEPESQIGAEPQVDPRIRELEEKAQFADQLQQVIFSDPELFNTIVQRLQGQPATQQTQTAAAETGEEEELQFELPRPPDYFNTEDLADPTSESYKWYQQYAKTIAEKARQATLKDVDRLVEEKLQEKERQRAEQERMRQLQIAMETVKQQVGADDATWQRFIQWANEPGKDMNTMLSIMYRIYTQMNSGNQAAYRMNPQQTQRRVEPNQGYRLPRYSEVGGETNQPQTLTEEEFLERDLFENALTKYGQWKKKK